jgi:hypothetical protein
MKMEGFDTKIARLLKLKEDHLKTIREIDNDLADIERVFKKYDLGEEVQTILPSVANISSPISTYSKTLSHEQKCQALIDELQSGFATDAADLMVKYEPGMDPEKAKKITTYYLSKLQRDGKIGYEQHGKKYKYISKKERSVASTTDPETIN